MDVLGMTLVFKLPGTTGWLVYASVAALVLELVSLVRSLWREHSPAVAVPLAIASLGAGPITAAIAAVYGGMTTAPGEPLRGRSVVSAALRGTFVMLLGALILTEVNRKQLSITQFVPNCALVAMALATIVWAFRAYRRTTSPVDARTKGLLLGLRILVIVLLAVWAARPELKYVVSVDVPGVVLVGIDTSTSMLLRDMPADHALDHVAPGVKAVARMDAVQDALVRNRRAFEAVAKKAQIRVFTFAGEPGRPRKFKPDESNGFAAAFTMPTPTGRSTAIRNSISAVLEPFTSKKKHDKRYVSAILLITDGCNNADTQSAEDMLAPDDSSKVPVFTVGVGSAKITGTTHMLNVRDLAAADEIDAFNRLPITAVVEAVGLAGRQVTVTCRFGDKEISTQQIDVSKPHLRLPLRFEHIPLTTGFKRLTLEATCTGPDADNLAGEQQAGRLVHVVDRNLRVLYVEAKFRYETKYISAALAAAGQRIRVDRRILTQPLRGDRIGDLTEDLNDWLTYHAIIFGDVSAEHFTPKQLDIVKKLVKDHGRGFCMIGGSKSFGEGGWDKTPIADILGPDLSKSKGQIGDEITVEITRDGLDSEIMRIGDNPAMVAEAWQSLGTIGGANVLVGPEDDVTRQTAKVLARSAKGEPLIVTMLPGSGRTLAIAFDTTWQWVLTPKDTAELQKRFWRQVALYLCNPKGSVWIATDRPRYDRGRLSAHGRTHQTIRVTAGVEDSQGRPLTTTLITVTMTAPDGKKTPLVLRTDKTMWLTTLSGIKQSGEYILNIETSVGGKVITDEHHFEIIDRDLERLDVLADFELLKRVAVNSKGRFCRLKEMPDLLRDLQVSSEPVLTEEDKYDKLSERLRWPIIVALIVLLCLEWSFRKRKGLV